MHSFQQNTKLGNTCYIFIKTFEIQKARVLAEVMPMHQHIVILLNTLDMLQNIVKYTKHFKLNKLQHTFTSSIKHKCIYTSASL